MFSQYTEDITKEQSMKSTYRVVPSKFVALDLNIDKAFNNPNQDPAGPHPFIKTPTIDNLDYRMDWNDTSISGVNTIIPQIFQSYYENAVAYCRDIMGEDPTVGDVNITKNDLEDVEYQLSKAKLLGCKGTTGTQASFLELFEGDHEKCKELDRRIAKKMGYNACFAVSGQTYSRKLDTQVLNVLSGIAQSAAKFSNDIRLLQHLKEVEEPFEKNQIGSSAMAYKRNPMRSERIGSLSRYVMVDVLNGAFTTATQWFERTLDDSANKRLSIPEAFLAIDGILNLYANVTDGLVVYPKVIEQRLRKELPFMATENIMMDAVKRGGDRQELHEKIRQHSMAASRVVKEEGGENDLLERIANDKSFGVTLEELEAILQPSKYVGRAPEQTTDFLNEVVYPAIAPYENVEDEKAEITV